MNYDYILCKLGALGREIDLVSRRLRRLEASVPITERPNEMDKQKSALNAAVRSNAEQLAALSTTVEKSERDIFHLGLKEANDVSEVRNHVHDLEQALDDLSTALRKTTNFEIE